MNALLIYKYLVIRIQQRNMNIDGNMLANMHEFYCGMVEHGYYRNLSVNGSDMDVGYQTRDDQINFGSGNQYIGL
ncbi:hypothetical protein BABINDRAFT_163389 [Babjeviella inositovora NRRL Y-12698]|uniref:Uncharacterized protein n=1 Tax=Babjeviella inositovora NRRL Y-12698 TaxID=984486 RepID=A0A1E3QJ93_9ASCO|nr:uncharacterized protein BABINDRAFT_163389 [Babjeviella inositovora NRRL Y-12698]ODQ77678.1 hypothetical protein BABINDRAFT_163389 [Babjeviella inositovora NRRL Y-12698]